MIEKNNQVSSKTTYAKELILAGFPLTAKYLNGIFKEARDLSIRYQVRQDFDDFKQLAIIEAVRLEPIFDKTKGASFMSFIRKPIKQVAQKLYGYSRSSTNKFNKVSKFMESYKEEHKVYPTVPEIAKALEMTEFLVKSIYFGKPFKVSLEALGDDFTIEEDGTNSELLDDILDELNETHRKIVKGYYLDEQPIGLLSGLYNIPITKITSILDEAIKELQEKHNV